MDATFLWIVFSGGAVVFFGVAADVLFGGPAHYTFDWSLPGSRWSRFGRVRRGKKAAATYRAMLAAAADYRPADYKALSDDEFEQLGIAIDWGSYEDGHASKTYQRIRETHLTEFNRRQEKARADAADTALGLPLKAERPARLPRLFTGSGRAIGADFFSTSTLAAAEQGSLRSVAQEVSQHPVADLTAVPDERLLEGGIALELESRYLRRKGERSLAVDTQYRRHEEEWRRRHLDVVPTEPELIARGVGDIGEVLAYRERRRQAEAAQSWDSTFAALERTTPAKQ